MGADGTNFNKGGPLRTFFFLRDCHPSLSPKVSEQKEGNNMDLHKTYRVNNEVDSDEGLIQGIGTAKVFLSQTRREKEDRVGESHSRSENKPHLFGIRLALGGIRTCDLAFQIFTRQTGYPAS
jgi:hypothetical protein